MEKLKVAIKEARPNIAESTVKTYASILSSIYKKVFNNDDIDVKKFDDTKKIIEYLKNNNTTSRKTILSALFIITQKQEYKDLMLEDIQQYNHTVGKQEKTEKQKENSIDKEGIKAIYDDLKNNAIILYKKKVLTNDDKQHIQNYIIVSLYGGMFVVPRRSADYCNMKIKNVDNKTDNYINKNKFVFNSYKTAKNYGEQQLDIPKELKSILNKWITINDTDYLLFDSSGKKLTSIKLCQRLNKIFNKKISINSLRHAFLTDKYKNTIKVNDEMAKDMGNMGSSTLQEKIYVQK